MNRLVNKVFSTVLALVTSASLLAGCGGGSHSSALPTTSSPSAPDYNGPLADATFKITIPGPTPSAGKRQPQYISSATKSLKFVINSSTTVTGTATTGTLGSYNALAWHLFNTGTLPTASCPASGPDFVCTVAIKLPPGTDNMTMTAYDNTGGTGNILSQQTQNFTVGVATANSFGVVLDANVTTPATSIVISGSGSCQAGPVGAAFGSVGTTPVNFTVTSTDAQGKTIVGPGLPKIQIQDNTATYQSASGTINGSGGTVGFTINQAAQTFTLTPSNTGITNASVNVKVVQADSQGTSDGLAFNHSQAFTFSAGTAPPTHNFLAAVEQTGTNTGRVDFFNISLDGGGNPAGFSAFSPASLAVTPSTNQAGQNDVDNPVSLLWDSTGDLIIGNGGTTGGNMACVPIGAISTGANSATTVTTNIDDPVGLAYEPRNGTVAVGNNAQGSPPVPELAEYALSGNYAPSTNNLTGTLRTGGGTIGQSLINLPSMPAGTFAITLTDGCEADPNPKNYLGNPVANPCGHAGTNEIAIFGPTGIVGTITDSSTFHVDIPWGLTWDSSANSQLIVANYSSYHPGVAFYTTAGLFQKTDGHNYFLNSQNPYMVVANSAGKFAVAYTTAFASGQVQIYSNPGGTGAPTPVFGPIPFNATTDSFCASNATTYPYGMNAAINGMTWLSSTRLLVSVQSFTGGVPQSGNVGGNAVGMGLYIFDTATSQTPAGLYDDQSCGLVAAYPAQKAFQFFSNKPFATAFKP